MIFINKNLIIECKPNQEKMFLDMIQMKLMMIRILTIIKKM
jgi:hypothetical protein